MQLYDLNSDPAEAHDLLAAFSTSLASPRDVDGSMEEEATRDGAQQHDHRARGTVRSAARAMARSSSSGPGAAAPHRNETAIAAAMLGHYLAAVRVGRRNLLRAYDEKRVTRGAVMVVWFCRQVEFSWSQSKWAEAQAMMCRGRSAKERRQLAAVPASPRGLLARSSASKHQAGSAGLSPRL
jgi:hypothetical protein